MSISQRLAYFDAMVISVACFAAGHRKIYKQDIRKLDIKFNPREEYQGTFARAFCREWPMKCNCLNLLHQNLPKINGNKTTKCKGQSLQNGQAICSARRTNKVESRAKSRAIVGRPGGLDWSAPRHEILHEWNARVLECAERY